MDFLVPKLRKAIEFCIEAHETNHRKNGDMYVVHPFSVALIISRYSDDVDVIVSALLHDVIEENGFSQEYKKIIHEKFGDKVYRIVSELTEDPTKTWEERKVESIEKYSIMLNESLIVKVADSIDNISNTIEIFYDNNEKVYKRFSRSHQEMSQMYRFRFNSISQVLKHPILEDYKNLLVKYEKIVAKSIR